MRIISLILVVAIFSGCAKRASVTANGDSTGKAVPDSSNHVNILRIGRNTVSHEWPLSTDTGYLSCVDGSVFFVTQEGKIYGMNGAAKQSHKYPPIDSIWKSSPNSAKIDLSELMKDGESLCK